MSDLDTRLLTGIYKALDPLSYDDEDTILDDGVLTAPNETNTEEATVPVTDEGIFEKFYHKMEVSEWGRVNKELRQHGLPAIQLADPKDMEMADSDRVVLNAAMAKKLRDMLHTLMRDCDRRQELLQELIATNTQLRQELRAQMEHSQAHQHDNKDGEGKNPDTTKLEEQLKQLQHENRKLQNHIRVLKEKTKSQQDSGFSSSPTVGNDTTIESPSPKPEDKRIVEIIDSYERRLANLKAELEEYRPSSKSPVQQSMAENKELQRYKAMVKTYERQLREAKNKAKVYEKDMELLKLELQSRPDIHELRESQSKTKKLEALLKKQRYYHENGDADGNKYSTHVDDIESLPVAQCQRMLKHICVEARVEDVDDVLPRIQKLTQLTDAHPKLEQFAHDVLRLVEQPDLPRPDEFLNHSPRPRPHAVWCEKTWHHVLPTLHYWVLQLRGLKGVQSALNDLQKSLLPWRKKELFGSVSTEKLVEAIQDMVAEDHSNMGVEVGDGSHSDDEEDGMARAPRAALQGIVRHFMHLFDVARLRGCYARMNDIYTKLAEVHNVMKALKNLLALDAGVRASEVVESVARVCEVANNSTLRQLRRVLEGHDMHMVLEKLEQHEQFFPVFQSIINKLMDILHVHRIDQIIPAVRAQKLLLSS